MGIFVITPTVIKFEATYCNQSFLNLHVGIFVITTTDLGTAFFNGEVRSFDV